MKEWINKFSFPHYKRTAYFSLLIILPRFADFLYVKIVVTITMVLSIAYWIIGDYKALKTKDELERLIELEKTYLVYQIGGAILVLLYLIQTYFKFNFEFSDAAILLLIAYYFIKKSIQKKYE